MTPADKLAIYIPVEPKEENLEKARQTLASLASDEKIKQFNMSFEVDKTKGQGKEITVFIDVHPHTRLLKAPIDDMKWLIFTVWGYLHLQGVDGIGSREPEGLRKLFTNPVIGLVRAYIQPNEPALATFNNALLTSDDSRTLNDIVNGITAALKKFGKIEQANALFEEWNTLQDTIALDMIQYLARIILSRSEADTQGITELQQLINAAPKIVPHQLSLIFSEETWNNYSGLYQNLRTHALNYLDPNSDLGKLFTAVSDPRHLYTNADFTTLMRQKVQPQAAKQNLPKVPSQANVRGFNDVQQRYEYHPQADQAALQRARNILNALFGPRSSDDEFDESQAAPHFPGQGRALNEPTPEPVATVPVQQPAQVKQQQLYNGKPHPLVPQENGQPAVTPPANASTQTPSVIVTPASAPNQEGPKQYAEHMVHPLALSKKEQAALTALTDLINDPVWKSRHGTDKTKLPTGLEKMQKQTQNLKGTPIFDTCRKIAIERKSWPFRFVYFFNHRRDTTTKQFYDLLAKSKNLKDLGDKMHELNALRYQTTDIRPLPTNQD